MQRVTSDKEDLDIWNKRNKGLPKEWTCQTGPTFHIPALWRGTAEGLISRRLAKHNHNSLQTSTFGIFWVLPTLTLCLSCYNLTSFQSTNFNWLLHKSFLDSGSWEAFLNKPYPILKHLFLCHHTISFFSQTITNALVENNCIQVAVVVLFFSSDLSPDYDSGFLILSASSQ